jgi:hypothetical protein
VFADEALVRTTTPGLTVTVAEMRPYTRRRKSLSRRVIICSSGTHAGR